MNKKIFNSLTKTVIALLIITSFYFIIGYNKIEAVTNTTTTENQLKYNNYLSDLSASNYQLTPEFNKNTTVYYISIPENITQVEIKATAESENSKIKITGNTKLTKTENTITVNVTSEKGTVKSYKIIATKQEDNGLKLTELSIENVEEFTPEFNKDTYYYEAKINSDESIKKLDITTKANNTNATVEIIGNDEKTLKAGENLITIMVKNGGDITTYQIMVNINVSKLIIQSNSISKIQEFANTVYSKTVEFFSDYTRKIAFLVAIAVILLILVIRLIIKIAKRSKEK